MENQNVIKRRRPQKYTTNEERQRTITQSKTLYMLIKFWICNICNYDYRLAGKHKHLKSKKHQMNLKKST